MNITFNNEIIQLPNDYMTLQDLAQWKQIPSQGSAIAINDKLIKHDKWSVTYLKDLDRVTVITAAFGG